MDTKEIYDEFYCSEANCIDFVMYMIKENDAPDNCQYCLFRVGLGALFCQVLQKYVDDSQCTVNDFIKYMLEKI